MPKVFDCFTFFNENDLLELRLQELYPVVDKFVIVHSNMNFRGREKENYLDYDRLKPYKDKIHEVWTKDLYGSNPWEREHHQRNLISTSCRVLTKDEDMIIISDVDEIPRRKTIEVFGANWEIMSNDLYRLRLLKYSYGINMLTGEGNTAARIASGRAIKHNTAQEIREMQPDNVAEDAGWEFSSLGTPEEIYLKFTSFAHSEFDDVISVDTFTKRMREGKDLLDRDIEMTPVTIDDSWPEGIKANPEYWSKYVWSVS